VPVISTTDSSSGDRHQQVTSAISMTTAAAAAQQLNDADAAVKRDVSGQKDQQALSASSDLQPEPVNSMSSSTRQNNKARQTIS